MYTCSIMKVYSVKLSCCIQDIGEHHMLDWPLSYMMCLFHNWNWRSYFSLYLKSGVSHLYKKWIKKASKMTLSNLKHSFIIKCMDRIKPPLRQTSYPIQYHSCLTALSKHLCLWLLPQSFLCISVFPKTWFFKSFDVKLSFHIHKSLSNFLDQDVLFINFICINHTMNGQYESWLQIVRSHYYS